MAHRLPVRIVGVGGGFDYGTAGGTHHALEDIAVMRALPGITVLAPADAEQTAAALTATWELPGPVYYRLGKGSRPVSGLDGRFTLGRADMVAHGRHLLILATGGMVGEAVTAAGLLAARGIEAAVMAVACLQPAPEEDIAREVARVPAVLTLEAHNPNGGLGSLVAEVMAEAGLARPFKRLSAGGLEDGRTGSAEWFNARHGLSAEGVVAAADALLARVVA